MKSFWKITIWKYRKTLRKKEETEDLFYQNWTQLHVFSLKLSNIFRIIPDFGVNTVTMLSRIHFPNVVQVELWILALK